MMNQYGYIDTPDGLLLCKTAPQDQKHCYIFATGEYVAGRRRLSVPRRFLAAMRAPTVIWKPHANPDVRAVVESTMIDLRSGDVLGVTQDQKATLIIVGAVVVIGVLSYISLKGQHEIHERIKREYAARGQVYHGAFGAALDHARAYNAFRLENMGGRWSKKAYTKKPGSDVLYQDHYMIMPDGSIWRPRVYHHYYSQPVGKLMMVKSSEPASAEWWPGEWTAT